MNRHPNHRTPDSLPAELRRVTVSLAARAWLGTETASTVVGAGASPATALGDPAPAVGRGDRRLARPHVGPQPRFVHRDFHPGNVLWSKGRSTGVVDWANACRGPWGCDVAHCRAQLILQAGTDAADRFLAVEQSLTGRRLDPYWEIASVLEHGPSDHDPATVTLSERRLEHALR